MDYCTPGPGQPVPPTFAWDGLGHETREPVEKEGTAVNLTVRDLVWAWLLRHQRMTFSFSEVTKGLCGRERHINRLTEDPREAIRAALVSLEAEGRLSLSPTARTGRGGKPGTEIKLTNRKASS